MKRLLLDAGGLRLLLAALGAHVAHEAVVTQLLLALRSLLPASHPREVVEGGGLELLAECLFVHQRVESGVLVTSRRRHRLLAALATGPWPPRVDSPCTRPRYALGTSHRAAQGPVGAAVRP